MEAADTDCCSKEEEAELEAKGKREISDFLALFWTEAEPGERVIHANVKCVSFP